jgi:hypothetical protein
MENNYNRVFNNKATKRFLPLGLVTKFGLKTNGDNWRSPSRRVFYSNAKSLFLSAQKRNRYAPDTIRQHVISCYHAKGRGEGNESTTSVLAEAFR